MRRKAKKTRKICAEHFKTRCCQRLGKILSQDELKLMMSSGKLKFLCKQSNAKTHWRIDLGDGKHATLVYDKIRSVFVTVLPDDGIA